MRLFENRNRVLSETVNTGEQIMPCDGGPHYTTTEEFEEYAAHRSKTAAYLCAIMQTFTPDFIKSLPVAIHHWWEEHQERDRKRVQQELEQAEESKKRAEALAKLTPYERGLLGIRDTGK